MIRQQTRNVIVLASIGLALTLMAINFGPAYAGLGILAMVARFLIRPRDILHFVPARDKGGETVYTSRYADLVDRFAERSGIIAPQLLHRAGSRATAMVIGSPRDSIIILRGAVHGLDTPEREALIGHEMGHLVRNHFLIKWATSMVFMLAFISLMRWTLLSGVEEMAGDPFVAPALGAAFFVILISTSIVHQWVGYLIEAEADDHAVFLTGRRDGVAAMLRRHLPPEGAGTFGRLVSWPIVRRLQRMEAAA